jgi:hypothetical protein
MRLWLRERSLPERVLVYAALAALAFVLAAGLGAVGALALGGDLEGLLGGGQPRPTDDRGAAGSGAASGPADPETADEGTVSEGTVSEGTVSETAQGTEGADPGEEASFVHRATDGNSRGDYTYLSDPRTNGDPDAVVLAEPSGPYERNIGVWYESGKGKWAIFNQDLAAVPAGSTFEVIVPPAAEGFVHRAGPADTFGNVTYLDDPLLNGRPDADVSVTPNWNPGGGEGVYNDHPVGALYDEDAGRWFVYNEDGARMPRRAAFNVAVSGATG